MKSYKDNIILKEEVNNGVKYVSINRQKNMILRIINICRSYYKKPTPKMKQTKQMKPHK